jgi:Carboxypeptidase regulatory-like domain
MNFKNLIGILLILGFVGCEKETLYLPDLTGDLVGYILTYNENAFLLDDHSGVTVTAIAYGQEQYTRTDRHGRFEFKGLRAGTYELHMEMEGFGTFKQFGVRHLGGMPTTLNHGPFCMYVLSDKDPVLSMALKEDSLLFSLNYTNNWNNDVVAKLYMSSTPGFSISNAQFITVRKLLNLKENQYYTNLFAPTLPFQKGQEVFIRTQVSYNDSETEYTQWCINSYYDINLNETIYPNLSNESSEFSFIMPD